MTYNHTLAPLKIHGATNIMSGHKYVAQTLTESTGYNFDESVMHAKHIVKCVNLHNELVEALEEVVKSEDLIQSHEDHIKGIIKKARGEI